ncbi:MAG: abscisic acid-deficient protein Aba4 family protein [Sphingomonadaceae bacterium]
MAQQLFDLGGLIAMIGWAALALSLFAAPLRRWVWPVTAYVVPALLAIAYILLLARGWGAEGGGFGSLEEVRALFADDDALAAGWIHYLAFDLFVGTWIARTGLAAGVPPLLLLPCLPLTFLFGPAGLLLALLLFLFIGEKTWKQR